MKHLRDLRTAVFEQSIKMDGPPSCELYYVCTGTWRNDATITNLVEAERAKLIAKYGFAGMKFVPVDLEKLKSYYRSIKQRVVRQFSLEKRAVIPKVDGVNQAYIGTVLAKEYLKLITDPDGNLERGLFYENVRDYLGDNTVNLEITAAIKNPEMHDKFVLLNNGVTIVARSITLVSDDITLRDYQVVNGCQTSHVLFYNRECLTDKLYLPLKLIATENQEVTNRVIKATNRQTEVKQEAFIALDPFQKRLEEFYASVFTPDQRLYYERRSKQYEADETPKYRVISIPTQTKCFLAMYLDEPHSTHRYYGELLNVYWVNKKTLFQSDHDPRSYYQSAYALYLVDREFRLGRLPTNLRRFRYHFLYLLRLLAGGDGHVSVVGGNKRTKEIQTSLHEILTDSSRLQNALKKASQIMTDVLARDGGEYRGGADRRNGFTNAIRAELATRTGPADMVKRSTPHASGVRTLRPSVPQSQGIIKRIGPEFGFITDEAGQDVFFHRSQWKSSGEVEQGMDVEFVPVPGWKGLRAISVKRLRKPASVG